MFSGLCSLCSWRFSRGYTRASNISEEAARTRDEATRGRASARLRGFPSYQHAQVPATQALGCDKYKAKETGLMMACYANHSEKSKQINVEIGSILVYIKNSPHSDFLVSVLFTITTSSKLILWLC